MFIILMAKSCIVTAVLFGRESPQEREMPIPLIPPEMILGGPCSEKADIWTVGCLVRICLPVYASCLRKRAHCPICFHFQIFELLTGTPLFKHDPPHLPPDMDTMFDLLFQMLFMSHEGFSPEQLANSSRAYDYFEPDGAIHVHQLPILLYHRVVNFEE